jgi:hypothetical protein
VIIRTSIPAVRATADGVDGLSAQRVDDPDERDQHEVVHLAHRILERSGHGVGR